MHVFLKICLAKLIMRESEIRIHFERSAALRYGFVIPVQQGAEVLQDRH